MSKETLSYILYVCVSVTILVSCGNNTPVAKVELTQDQYDKLVKGSGSPIDVPKPVTFPKTDHGRAGDNDVRWQVVKASDGHDYMENNQYNAYVCIHYVDCKLCAQRDSLKHTR